MESIDLRETNFDTINISKQVAGWEKLLHKCTIQLEEKEGFELLFSNNAKFRLLLETAPLNFELLKLTTMTASIPLSQRKKLRKIFSQIFPMKRSCHFL